MRLAECLITAGERVALMVSKPAQLVIHGETDLALPARAAPL